MSGREQELWSRVEELLRRLRSIDSLSRQTADAAHEYFAIQLADRLNAALAGVEILPPVKITTERGRWRMVQSRLDLVSQAMDALVADVLTGKKRGRRIVFCDTACGGELGKPEATARAGNVIVRVRTIYSAKEPVTSADTLFEWIPRPRRRAA